MIFCQDALRFGGQLQPPTTVRMPASGRPGISTAEIVGTSDLRAPVFYPTVRAGSPPGEAAGFVVADLNRDGYPDLAFATGQAGEISWLLNNGDGTFSPPTGYDIGYPG